MKKYLLRKKIFAIAFILVLFTYSALNLFYGGKEWYEAVVYAPEDATVSERITILEDEIIESMYLRMQCIEGYSYFQKLLDKKEFNNFSYIIDEDGYIHYASFFQEDYTNVEVYAKRIKRMQEYLASKGTKVLFMITPSKYDKEQTRLQEGMPINNPDYLMDELLFYLNRYGVETLDCRKYIPNENMTIQEAFFRSDHHWTIPAAFEATKVLVNTIEERFGEDLDPDNFYTNEDNYEKIMYQSGMLGSMGRKTGANFCGLENFEAYWPKFENEYIRECINEDEELRRIEGNTQKALMNSGILAKDSDIYNDSQYSLYLDVIISYESIKNKNNPDGCKIFAIRDSYMSPMMVFLAPMCGQLDAIWSLEESDNLDIEKQLRENTYDYVIMEIYPYNINDKAFNFFKEE